MARHRSPMLRQRLLARATGIGAYRPTWGHDSRVAGHYLTQMRARRRARMRTRTRARILARLAS